MTFTLVRLIMGFLWAISAYKWGDWKNWRKYYPTMLFFGMGDLIYHLVFRNKLLWEFQTDIIAPYINELFVIFTIFFSTVLLFLSNYPKKVGSQAIYITIFVIIYMITEIFTFYIGMIKHYNGWTFLWSFVHNIFQFTIMIIHYKKPILAWTIGFSFMFLLMYIFGVPLVVAK